MVAFAAVQAWCWCPLLSAQVPALSLGRQSSWGARQLSSLSCLKSAAISGAGQPLLTHYCSSFESVVADSDFLSTRVWCSWLVSGLHCCHSPPLPSAPAAAVAAFAKFRNCASLGPSAKAAATGKPCRCSCYCCWQPSGNCPGKPLSLLRSLLSFWSQILLQRPCGGLETACHRREVVSASGQVSY